VSTRNDTRGQTEALGNGRPTLSLKQSVARTVERETLTLREAAAFCNMNHECFRRKVKEGVIPGAKVGKAWVFLKYDLIQYIRSLYATSAEEAVRVTGKEVTPCRSTVEIKSGGLASQRQLESAYRKALEPEAE
jgi:Helix-turn-helix domain